MTKFWFDHLHLIAPDPEKMADFFVKAFEAEKVSVSKLPDGRIRAELNITGARILINNPQPTDTRSPDNPRKRYGTEHFGMKVDKIESALQQCLAAEGKLVMDIR
jgi:hypothetical protein